MDCSHQIPSKEVLRRRRRTATTRLISDKLYSLSMSPERKVSTIGVSGGSNTQRVGWLFGPPAHAGGTDFITK
jgi:hypothetical protein